MNTLLASKAKVNRALTFCRSRSVFAQSQERGGQQIDDLLVRMPLRFREGGRFVMKHGGRLVGERFSC